MFAVKRGPNSGPRQVVFQYFLHPGWMSELKLEGENILELEVTNSIVWMLTELRISNGKRRNAPVVLPNKLARIKSIHIINCD
jgi:hypothetical protein